jgi:tetratricopeptide (TPR) repeat protein
MSTNTLSAHQEQIAREVLGHIFKDDANLNAYIENAKATLTGKTFAQGFGLKDVDLEVILSIAASRYTAARYEDAARLYSFAALLDHFDTRALQGAGMALQKLGLFDAALECFAAVLLQAPEKLEVTVMLAESMAMSGRKKEALDLLHQLTELKAIEQQPLQNTSIHERVTALIALLTKNSEPYSNPDNLAY